MLDNLTYDLMSQLVEEHRSLWRLQGPYMQDAAGNRQSQNAWQSIIQDKENEISRLESLLVSQLQSQGIIGKAA